MFVIWSVVPTVSVPPPLLEPPPLLLFVLPPQAVSASAAAVTPAVAASRRRPLLGRDLTRNLDLLGRAAGAREAARPTSAVGRSMPSTEHFADRSPGAVLLCGRDRRTRDVFAPA